MNLTMDSNIDELFDFFQNINIYVLQQTDILPLLARILYFSLS